MKYYTPKSRIESYSILGTIVSPNKILLMWEDAFNTGLSMGSHFRNSVRNLTLACGANHAIHLQHIQTSNFQRLKKYKARKPQFL